MQQITNDAIAGGSVLLGILLAAMGVLIRQVFARGGKLVELRMELEESKMQSELARLQAERDKLTIAATAGVRIAEAHAGPQLDIEGDDKKMIADGAAADLLGAAVSPEVLKMVPEVVQAAWQQDKDERVRSSMRSEALTPAETPTAKRNQE